MNEEVGGSERFFVVCKLRGHTFQYERVSRVFHAASQLYGLLYAQRYAEQWFHPVCGVEVGDECEVVVSRLVCA